MIRYFDITNDGIYSLEVSFIGGEWKEKKKINNSEFSVRLLKRCSEYEEDSPYIVKWRRDYGNISVPSGAWGSLKLGQISNEFIYLCIGNTIVKVNKSDARKVWSKTFGNTSIRNIKMLDEEDGIYVQYSYYKFESEIVKSNFLKIDKNGEIIWSLGIKRRDDLVTGFSIKNNILTVFTWDCFSMLVDKNNGNILEEKFTK